VPCDKNEHTTRTWGANGSYGRWGKKVADDRSKDRWSEEAKTYFDDGVEVRTLGRNEDFYGGD
jgi:hypothetical protein